MDNENTLYFQRNEDGAWTNLPRKYADHAKSFEWGKECGEAADLALNILQWALEKTGFEDEYVVEVNEGGCVFAFAYVMHEAFMRQVIARLPYSGGELTLSDIKYWINHYPQIM
jgi:hypothetical protein